MRPRNSAGLGLRPVLFSEEESKPLASTPVQGRRRAARAQSLAILHKVGCSWSVDRAQGVLLQRSAGPTTPPRFERCRSTPCARSTGEPTVSHEGCSGARLLLRSCSIANHAILRAVPFSEEESRPLASTPVQGRRRAARAQSLAILHKVGCSWSAGAPQWVLLERSAGPTTPPRFERSSSTHCGAPAGEPTVSHEGCSGARLLLRSCSIVDLAVLRFAAPPDRLVGGAARREVTRG